MQLFTPDTLPTVSAMKVLKDKSANALRSQNEKI